MKAATLAFITALAGALPLAAAPAVSQAETPAASKRIGADRKPVETITLYPGAAPGSEGWKQVERTQPHPSGGGTRLVRNVVSPALEVYLPDPAKATGAGVIVA